MIIGIVGISGSGKDTVAKHIRDKYNIPMIVSYTTREMRRGEKNGREHWFISKEYMKFLMEHNNIIAYTKNDKTGVEYCATLDDITRDIVYIINPEGIRWLKKNNPEIEVKTLMIEVDRTRSESRQSSRGDDEKKAKERLDSEIEEFLEFQNNEEYDKLIVNNKDLDFLFNQVDLALQQLGVNV